MGRARRSHEYNCVGNFSVGGHAFAKGNIFFDGSKCLSWVFESIKLDTLEDPGKTLASIEENIPFGKRMTTDREIADAVVFMASPRSSHTTGQIFYPDGGYAHLDRSYGKIQLD